MVSFSRSYIYEMIVKGRFPKPKEFGRASRWFKGDIEQWLIKEKEEHDNEQGLFTHVGKAIDDLLS